jgi:hypothetical protein
LTRWKASKVRRKVSRVSKVLRRTGAREGYSAGGWSHWCPGCKAMHHFAVDGPQRNGARWTFDGNLDRPTFSPSMNIRTGRFADPIWRDPDGDDLSSVCHYFLRGGMLQFLGDSTHALAGQTVPLPELPE